MKASAKFIPSLLQSRKLRMDDLMKFIKEMGEGLCAQNKHFSEKLERHSDELSAQNKELSGMLVRRREELGGRLDQVNIDLTLQIAIKEKFQKSALTSVTVTAAAIQRRTLSARAMFVPRIR